MVLQNQAIFNTYLSPFSPFLPPKIYLISGEKGLEIQGL